MSAELHRRIENIIRFGTIAEVDYQHCTARVKCGEILTDFLPFLTLRTGTTKTWSPPTLNEQCVVLAMSGELTTATILTGLYTQNCPSDDPDLHIIQFADGAVIKYHQKNHHLEVSGIATASMMISDSMQIHCPQIDIFGDVNIQGTVRSEGDQIAGGISQINHIHGGVASGPATTGEPQ